MSVAVVGARDKIHESCASRRLTYKPVPTLASAYVPYKDVHKTFRLVPSRSATTMSGSKHIHIQRRLKRGAETVCHVCIHVKIHVHAYIFIYIHVYLDQVVRMTMILHVANP